MSRFLSTYGTLAVLSLTLGCRSNSDDKASPPDVPGFSLAVPKDRWADSKFCGDVRPELPDMKLSETFEEGFLNEKLKGDGLNGWMHGAVDPYGQYIFTYRKEDPNDPWAFFIAQQFSLVPADESVRAQLVELNRHDKVRLFGAVFNNGSPLVHLRVSRIEMLKKFELATENHYSVDPLTLQERPQRIFGMIHAIVESKQFGSAFILESKDFVMPIAIPKGSESLISGSYRGDILDLAIAPIPSPKKPAHFMLNTADAEPMNVVDSILNCHQQERSVTGHLAKFEKSPAISLDVFAIRVVDANGMARNFTLFPDSNDPELFFKLSEKARAAWDKAAEEPRVVRNFRDKPTIKVTAKGRLNVVSSEQANAQIYMQSVDDLTLEIVE